MKQPEQNMDNDFEIDDSLFQNLKSQISQHDQNRANNRMLLAQKIISGAKAKYGDKPGYKSAFAKDMGKDPSIISRWLSGTHNFEIDTLFDIQCLLNITLIQTVVGNKNEYDNKTILLISGANTIHTAQEPKYVPVEDRSEYRFTYNYALS